MQYTRLDRTGLKVSRIALGMGFLTGKIDQSAAFADGDIRNTIPRFSAEARQANLRIQVQGDR